MTALMLLNKRGDKCTRDVLLELGVDASKEDDFDRTVIDYASGDYDYDSEDGYVFGLGDFLGIMEE